MLCGTHSSPPIHATFCIYYIICRYVCLSVWAFSCAFCGDILLIRHRNGNGNARIVPRYPLPFIYRCQQRNASAKHTNTYMYIHTQKHIHTAVHAHACPPFSVISIICDNAGIDFRYLICRSCCCCCCYRHS